MQEAFPIETSEEFAGLINHILVVANEVRGVTSVGGVALPIAHLFHKRVLVS